MSAYLDCHRVSMDLRTSYIFQKLHMLKFGPNFFDPKLIHLTHLLSFASLLFGDISLEYLSLLSKLYDFDKDRAT